MSVPQVKLTFPGGPCAQKGSTFSGGLFINNEFVASESGKTFAVLDPSTGKEIAQVAEGSEKDVDRAVKAAQKAFDTTWGTKVPGHERGKLLMHLADLVEANIDELSSIESLDNGKPFSIAKGFDVAQVAANFRYMGGWADKNTGQVIETNDAKLTYTRHEPIGVCGQIIPWNFPILMASWKLGPALATGNTVVLKTAEQTPLSVLKLCELIKEAGFPPGVVNVVSGFGPVAGAAIASHMDIHKVAFTGSTLVGRQIMQVAAKTNLKKVTLELGGKSPNIIYDDADVEQAAKWAAFGFSFNAGQCCCAGTRVYVQEGIHEKFMKRLKEVVANMHVSAPWDENAFHGPLVSQLQFDRVTGFIEKGIKEGATVEMGGKRHGNEGYFVQPTIFSNVKETDTISKEEIFGPVLVTSTFKDTEDLLAKANDSYYGLAAAVFTRDISRALETANRLQAGTVWINTYNLLDAQVPFGGYKQSGIGRELGQYALANYTNVKSVHVNISLPAPI
ncbi:unnamed protein product [Tilletia controversa]|uniref:Aldehyde dehydrogenase domain-containing protein n=3 Tax=Tilletia TaxID=13289 RepID=A0A8X7MTT3_9BASI|nr:hypothetical protein CF335_g7888 [Tilletia laevis]KAE8197950.1 hypothetical protein CF328_g3685 [Tilletia controversa]KAE8261358.1 hypothetical protein A4X03_0g3317 [Tilletia caries]KAE8191421.1 hypothetical protein CF336_g4880 [Tilletia laevis]KAE8247456.1 hypothetical protein A4X06_0g4445 [Tilletia controversa]